MAGIFEGLAQTAVESCQRLKELVARMQRFTNLDRAEEQGVDLNELVRDNNWTRTIRAKSKGRNCVGPPAIAHPEVPPTTVKRCLLEPASERCCSSGRQRQNFCYQPTIQF